MSSDYSKLDLGCGRNKPDGREWLGIDRVDGFDTDIVRDLEENPSLPFEDETFEMVQARHFLEHLTEESFDKLMEEVYRVLEDDGVFKVVLPHFLSWNSATIDHKNIFSRKSFDVYGIHSFPNQKPALFSVNETEYVLEKNLDFVRFLSWFFSKEFIATYIPNSVREIKFVLRPEGDLL